MKNQKKNSVKSATLHDRRPERKLSSFHSNVVLRGHVRADWSAGCGKSSRAPKGVFQLLPYKCLFVGDCHAVVSSAGERLSTTSQSSFADFRSAIRNRSGVAELLRDNEQRVVKKELVAACLRPQIPHIRMRNLFASAGAEWSQ